MTVTVRQLADWIGGEVVGDGDQAIRDARPLTEAEPGDVTFVEHEKHLAAWNACRASAAVVCGSVPPNGRPLIRVADPLMAFVSIVLRLRAPTPDPSDYRIDPSAHVHPTAVLGDDVTVGPFVVVGAGTVVGRRVRLLAGVYVGRNCRLGDDVVLHPRVVVYEDCTLGDRVTVHANSVIGADGFGFRTHGGRHIKVPQLGRVEIGDDVEIGACSAIDRGTFGPTRIGNGTKMDNFVQVAHNCQIGRHNLLAAHVGIGGSTVTGDYVVMAGQSGVADHLHVGHGAILGAQAGLTRDVPAGARMFGTPNTTVREHVLLATSPEKVARLQKEVKRIKRHLNLGDGE